MARSTKTMATKTLPALPGAGRGKGRVAAPASTPAAAKAARTKANAVPDALLKITRAGGGKAAAGPSPAAAAPRVPPPSKGELRAQIERLEAANAALKTKGREASRAAKLETRRIAELEEQVAVLQQKAAKAPPSVPAASERPVRRAGPSGRKKAIDPGDAVPPEVAVEDAEPLEAEASAAREALEENLSGGE